MKHRNRRCSSRKDPAMNDFMIASAIQSSRKIAIAECHHQFIHNTPTNSKVRVIWTWTGKSIATVWTAFTTNFHAPKPSYDPAQVNHLI
jgi:hypothetical protein